MEQELTAEDCITLVKSELEWCEEALKVEKGLGDVESLEYKTGFISALKHTVNMLEKCCIGKVLW